VKHGFVGRRQDPDASQDADLASSPQPRPGLAQTGHSLRTSGVALATSEALTGEKRDAEAADVYKVSLPTWEGPLDLLLEIIQKHELDILDIPIGFITEKYLEYLDMMKALPIDVASEYLVMAATLAHIKSKMLLPEPPKDPSELGEEEELDPRAELVRRLLEYQKYKSAAADLGARDTLGASVFPRGMGEERPDGPAPFAPASVIDLLDAFAKVLARTKVKIEHEVMFDRISITDRITELVDILRDRRSMPFEDLFGAGSSVRQSDLVVTFLAVLEMVRVKMLRVYQAEALAPIHVELIIVDADAPADSTASHDDPDDAFDVDEP
jgi:segregation and condensation protein A